VTDTSSTPSDRAREARLAALGFASGADALAAGLEGPCRYLLREGHAFAFAPRWRREGDGIYRSCGRIRSA
jgi:hypothetical protein